MDFSSGFACLSTEEIVTDANKRNKQYEYTVIMPLLVFLSTFSKPKEFAKELSDRASGLIHEWKTNNAGSHRIGKRVPVDKHWTLAKHEWEDRNGQVQKSALDFALNTYYYTATVQYKPLPHQLRHVDIKASENTAVTYFLFLLFEYNVFNFSLFTGADQVQIDL